MRCVFTLKTPAEANEQLHLGDGGFFNASASGDSLTLSKPVDRIARQLHFAGRVVEDHPETFRALAQR